MWPAHEDVLRTERIALGRLFARERLGKSRFRPWPVGGSLMNRPKICKLGRPMGTLSRSLIRFHIARSLEPLRVGTYVNHSYRGGSLKTSDQFKYESRCCLRTGDDCVGAVRISDK